MSESPINSFGIANVVIPRGGPKCVPWNMDFSGVGQHVVDLSLLVQQTRIEYVQCIYVDNADNANPLTIKMDLTNQRIVIPAHTQGYYPILQPNNPVITFSTTVAAVVVNVQFLNVPVQPANWKTV